MANDTATCTGAKCQRPAVRKGMCNRCYLRWYRSTPQAERPTISTTERFWEKVSKDGGIPAHAPYLGQCWEWTGARRPNGYGMFGVRPAHVFSLELAGGDPCPPGMQGCHRCDNPPCVRPSHIYFGTRQNNADDAWSRARHPVGSQRRSARLTEAQVEDIRNRYAAGESGKTLAEEFAMNPCSIYGITGGTKWPQAPGPITKRSAA